MLYLFAVGCNIFNHARIWYSYASLVHEQRSTRSNKIKMIHFWKLLPLLSRTPYKVYLLKRCCLTCFIRIASGFGLFVHLLWNDPCFVYIIMLFIIDYSEWLPVLQTFFGHSKYFIAYDVLSCRICKRWWTDKTVINITIGSIAYWVPLYSASLHVTKISLPLLWKRP